MPRVTPKINRVYLKGVTVDTSPVLIAFIRQEYAATPNTTTPNMKLKILTSNITNPELFQSEYIKPENANAIKPCNPSTKTLRFAGAARLAKSLPANPIIPISANIERNEKPSVVG